MTAHRKPLAIELAIIVVAVLAYGAFLTLQNFKPAPIPTPTVSVAPSPPTRAELLKLVNAERIKNGVKPLVEDPLLDQSAQWKANDEVVNNYFGHVKPGTSDNNGLDYLNSIDKNCTYVSENLHWANQNILTANETVNGWISSPEHHAAMIDPKYSLTGFGIEGKQVVEHFCEQ